MSQWNSGGAYPPDPNQHYYAGQPGYPPPQQGGGGGYPPQQGGYPPPPGGYPPQPGFQGAGYPPNAGYPQAPPSAPGFQPPPYAANDPYNQGEQTPFSYNADGYGANYSGGEDPGEVKGFDFSEQSVRRGFIRKVYSILTVQLLITLGFIAWLTFDKKTKAYVAQHSELLIIAFVVLLVTMIALACCGEMRRKAPMNFIFLFIFTIAESFILGVTAAYYKTDSVMMAVGVTAAVCIGLTLFALQTKWDFTIMGGFLFVAVLILFLFGILAIFIRSNILHLVIACAGALIFSLYLIYDTQLMMGGKHKYSISPEEYIFAALNLYIDIINIFIYILQIIGAARD